MGGVAGHLSHLHENLDFTFGEIKSILSSVASANIDVIEKVDGQNVFFTWDASVGQIRTARNDGDIKKGGMSPQEYADKWAAHPNPNVAKAFMNGFHAVERAMGKLGPEQLQEIFGDHGQNYINAEIMYTKNPNIIVYSGDWIVLHNMHQFDDEGKKTIESGGAFSSLVSAVETAEGEMDEEGWQMSGPKLVELKDISNGTAYNDFEAELNSITGMSDSATIGDYVSERLRTGVVGDLPIPVDQQEEVLKTILGKEGAKNVNALKKMVPKDVRPSISAIATSTKRYGAISQAVGPIEKAISDFAIEVLKGLESFFISDHDAEIARMKEQLQDAITKLQNVPEENAEAAAALLDKQLGKLGDIENVASDMEGVVFEHPPGSRILYKLTGTFAMNNQIVGRAGRMSVVEGQNESLLRTYVRMAMMAG